MTSPPQGQPRTQAGEVGGRGRGVVARNQSSTEECLGLTLLLQEGGSRKGRVLEPTASLSVAVMSLPF